MSLHRYFNYDIDKMNDAESREILFKYTVFRYSTEFTEEITNNCGFFSQVFSARIFIQEIIDNNDSILKKHGLNSGVFISHPDFFKFIRIANEKQFIDDYQAFEVYLSNVLKYIFWFSPEKLPQKEYAIYKTIFGTDLLIERYDLINKHVRSIIFYNNIKDSIKKVFELIDIPCTISEDDLNKINFIAINRNQIIHNLGIIDKVYISKLNRINYPCTRQIGEYIFGEQDNQVLIHDIGPFYEKIEAEIKLNILKWYDIQS